MHRWTEDDDLIGYYLYRFGDKDLSLTKQDLAEILGMGWGSMGLKIANFKAIDDKGGMDGFSLQAKRVYQKYKDMPDSAFQVAGMETIVKILARKHEEISAELAKRKHG